ncbi:hypothetical protein BC827DRAFT_1238797 [Russula dissimulans]|nr:hypothetical protein BC827DRAFT_1238797 [Russula dissimulans]
MWVWKRGNMAMADSGPRTSAMALKYQITPLAGKDAHYFLNSPDAILTISDSAAGHVRP